MFDMLLPSLFVTSGFLSAFYPRGGGQNEIVLGEGQVCICVRSVWQTRGGPGHAPPGNFDFGPFIRHNLVKSVTVVAQT